LPVLTLSGQDPAGDAARWQLVNLHSGRVDVIDAAEVQA
tara:strand:- start:168 stop:284 length:117 start_codon:yes stop_codon:yes gene_type:complete